MRKLFKLTSEFQKNIITTIAVLLSAAFMTGSLPAGPSTGRFITLALLMYILWKGTSSLKQAAVKVVLSALCIAGVMLLSFPSQLAVLAAVCFIASCFASENEYNIYKTLNMASLFIFILFAAMQLCEPVRILVDNAASTLSGIGGLLIGRIISVGPTYTGIYLMLIFLLYYIALMVVNRRVFSKAIIIFSTLIPFICCILYTAVWSILSELPIYDYIATLEPLVSPFDYRILLFIFLFIPLPRVIGKVKNYESSKLKKMPVYFMDKQKNAVVFSVILIVFITIPLLLTGINTGSRQGPKIVTVYSSADSPVILDKPEFNKYGIENAGMFGMMPEYLKADGYTVRFTDHPGDEELKGTGVLVIINLMKTLNPGYEQAIWRYIKEGGSLLVLGDHTGTEQIRAPSNHLLVPVGISFNFDSAIPFKDMWRQSYFFTDHPVLKGLDWHNIQVNIGASLDVKYPASAVLIGRNGYSDLGDMNNASGGFLGDMHFNRGERLGDLVLAAEASYGDGKVFVFGDTSPLQIVNLSCSYEFIDRLFSWLTGKSGLPSQGVDAICVILFLLSLVLIPFLAKNKMAFRIILPAIVAISIIIEVLPIPVKGTGYTGKLVGIDATGSSMVKTNRDKDSIDGLCVNIERNGYLPFLIKKEGYDLNKFDALVFISPNVKMSSERLKGIKDYMNNGGLVIMSSGLSEYDGCCGLLDLFGLGIQNIPLGKGNKEENNINAEFWDAWALSIKDTSKVDILAETWGYPVAVHASYGKGGFVFICDSQFFRSKNLEDIEYFSAANIEFINKILTEYMPER